MKELNIIIERKFYTSDISTNIVSRFFIEYQGKCFPNNEWTDFAEPVLGMWTHKLLQNRYSSKNKFKLYFMDGPFWMDVYKDDNMQLSIDCINDRGINKVIEHTMVCSYYDFLRALYNALKKFNYILYSDAMHKGQYESVYRQNLINIKEIKDVLNSAKL